MTEVSEPECRTLRRLYRGTRVESAYAWPFERLDELDSSFNVQEYLQQLIRQDKNNIDLLIAVPESVDQEIWQYEHLRQVCLELNLLVVNLETECTKEICPEMKADGWLYLCAAHPGTQSCSAIDYTIHTLDGAANLLNNSKYFPSRIHVPPHSLKQFQAIARRLYRIFAHAYFHHREIYEDFENDTALYARFLRLSQTYNLIQPSQINIPQHESNLENDDIPRNTDAGPRQHLDSSGSESKNNKPEISNDEDDDDQSIASAIHINDE
ncbi:Mob1/phocein [Radiomyces spectabilis]|uniref:Mob1/phocein n=1 Tax=Radiomyces spectabilis TaxID=64574 RepID=UPI00221F0FD6|nr:Mob1/phocein [Radiomyces spectabilis]KAI8365385.1 Mob1/phocein [Radiomyces spectabilis]